MLPLKALTKLREIDAKQEWGFHGSLTNAQCFTEWLSHYLAKAQYTPSDIKDCQDEFANCE
eukprot:10541240-Karenia_brevis.AAC.1